jgi:hypothetical protein
MNTFNTPGKTRNQIKELWFLWAGLFICCLGIFLVSVWLTDSIELFISQSSNKEALFVGVTGFLILVEGIIMVLSVVLKNNKQAT